MNKVIYFDHAATTPLKGEVLEKMTPYLTSVFGNANSTYSLGRAAVKALDDARDEIAALIGAARDEVYFTSGGTEGDNWVLRGAAEARGSKNTLVVSEIEHAAVLGTANELNKYLGVTVKKVAPDSDGILSPESYFDAVDSDTFLACAMLANNEVGTIEPIQKIAERVHEKGAKLFTDAVQGAGAIEINVKTLGVDALTASAHKFGGPKGAGFIYIKKDFHLPGLITGGHQERELRGGTSNVAAAVGTAEALKLARKNLDLKAKKIAALRDEFVNKVTAKISGVTLNGGKNSRLANNANLTFNCVSGEALLAILDLNGVCASLGAACSAGTVEPSYVLKAIGKTDEQAKSTLRFTFGEENTLDEVDYCVSVLSEAVEKLRKLS